MRPLRLIRLVASLALFVAAANWGLVRAQETDERPEARSDTSALARALASRDPLERQRAAEDLARLAAVDQKKLIEGYRLQEKNRKVRLALDWALYRTGKSEALFQIVAELNSSRHDQAVEYLSQLESPDPLYLFLKQETNQAKVTVGLLEGLGRIGNAQSLDVVKPFRDSFSPGVAEAAELATEQIERRLTQSEPSKPARPRTVEKPERL